jgi:hypothetical protein
MSRKVGHRIYTDGGKNTNMSSDDAALPVERSDTGIES